MELEVENIKCGGCASHIQQQLIEIDGVEKAEVDVASGRIRLNCREQDDEQLALLCEIVKQRLLKMGYPQRGSVEGLKAAGAKAKSFVSCAVGRLSDDKTNS